jgi:hypothetical protein
MDTLDGRWDVTETVIRLGSSSTYTCTREPLSERGGFVPIYWIYRLKARSIYMDGHVSSYVGIMKTPD